MYTRVKMPVILAIQIMSILVGAIGCGHNKSIPVAKAPIPTTSPVVLAPGDTVELKFYYAKELNETQVIRSDGKLTLQFIGEVQAAGLTPGQLADNLKESYKEFVKFPGVGVVVRSSYVRKVYVSGEVRKPGVLDLPARMSVLEAIMISGGFDFVTGDTRQVIIMRKNDQGGRTGYGIDLREALAGAETSSFMLEPEDIVFVPRTPIVNVNQFVQQYIAGVLPTGVSYSHSLGDGTVNLNTNNK